MTTLRLYRGIAVPSHLAAIATSSIQSGGLVEGQGRWVMEQLWRLPSGISVEDAIRERVATRDAEWRSAVCACGTLESAAYYAWEHNRKGTEDTPILMEFEADIDQVRVDGRDFLYLAFQMGDPESARGVLQRVYGSKILMYADEAWGSSSQEERVSLCDLATLDPEVVQAHHANRVVIQGRYGTTFESAFTVAYPVLPAAISRVWTPESTGTERVPSVTIGDILPARPAQ